MGLWHEIEAYPTAFQNGECNNAFYTLNNGVVDVFNTQVINQSLDTINGVATIASDDGSAKLLVSFPVAGTNRKFSFPFYSEKDFSWRLAYCVLITLCFTFQLQRKQIIGCSLQITLATLWFILVQTLMPIQN